MKPTSRLHRGFVAATLRLSISIALPAVFSGSILLAQAVPLHGAPVQPPHVALHTVSPAVPTVDSPQNRQIAAQKLHLARKALAAKDIASAERYVNDVQAMQLTYQETEDNPERVQALLQQHRQLAELARTQGNTEHYRQQYARFQLIQADTMIRRGELDLAAQLTQEAAMQGVQYTQKNVEEGLEPNVMARRIDDVRRVQSANRPAVVVQMPQQPLAGAAKTHLEQAQQMLQQARTALEAGQLEQAEQLARRAAALELPEYAFEQGLSPNRFLTELAARRQNINLQPVTSPTQNTQVVQVGGAGQTLAPPVPTLSRTPAHIDETLQRQQMLEQRISMDIMQELSNAQRLVEVERRPDAALEILHNLKQRVERSAQITADRKTAYITHIDRAIVEAQRFQERYAALENLNQMNEAVLADLRHRQQAFLNKEQQLQTMFKECQKLMEEHRYEEAVILAKKIREFAPDEPAAQLLATTTEFVYLNYRNKSIEADKRAGVIDALIGVDVASTIPQFGGRNVLYTPNWAELTQTRQASNRKLRTQRPAKEIQILDQLERPVSLSVNQPMPLEQAVNMLCGEAGITPYFDRAALNEVNIPTGVMVSVPTVNGIKAKNALRVLLEQLNLEFVVKNELLQITSKRRAQGELVTYMYYVGDICNVAPPAVDERILERAFERSFEFQSPHSRRNNSNGNTGNTQSHIAVPMPVQGIQMPNGMPTNMSLSQNGNAMQEGDPNVLGQQWGGGYGQGGMMGGYGQGGMMGGMGGYGQGGMMGGMGGYGQGGMMGGYGQGGMMGGMMGGGMGMGFGDIYSIIQSVIQPESWQMMGGEGEIQMHYATQSLAIRQTEEVHAQIEDLLVQIRKMHDLQIAIEVRYITLSDQFYERMGTAFNMVFNNDKAFGRITRVTNELPDESGEYVTTTTPRGNNVTVGLSAPRVFNANASIPFNQDSFNATVPVFGGYNPSAGISTGFALLSNIETYFFIQAAQGDNRSSIMEAPKVMLQNGQPGMVNDTTQIPFVTSVTPVVADFAIGYQPIVTMLNSGQVLHIQATVSNDRQYVRMTLNPTFTTLVRVRTFKYFGDDVDEETTTSTTTGDEATTSVVPVPSADPRGGSTSTRVARSGITVQQPEIATFSVSTTVNCPDGGTVLLGGIKRLSEARSEAGVPILNKIPYIQRLFSNTGIGRDTQSVMIMATPRIIIQEEEEQHIMGRNMP